MIALPSVQLNALALKLVIGIGCLALLALLIHDRNRWKAKTAHYAETLAVERGAHAGTIANYRAAVEQARQADLANAERVSARQAAITERTANDFEKRLADARAAARRLRGESAAASGDPGGGRAAALPGLPVAAEGPAQAARQDRFSDTDERARRDRGALGPEDALIATEQAIQLDELIKWVNAQSAVGDTDPRSGSSRSPSGRVPDER